MGQKGRPGDHQESESIKKVQGKGVHASYARRLEGLLVVEWQSGSRNVEVWKCGSVLYLVGKGSKYRSDARLGPTRSH